MKEVVGKTSAKYEPGYLYFISKDGNVCRMKGGRAKAGEKKIVEVVSRTGIKREKGYLYTFNRDGSITRSQMVHGRKRKTPVEEAGLAADLGLPEL